MNKFREKLNSHKELEIILPVIIILMIALPLSYNNNQTKQNSSSGNNSQRRTPEQVVTTPTPTSTAEPEQTEAPLPVAYDSKDNVDRSEYDFSEKPDIKPNGKVKDFDMYFMKLENNSKNMIYSPLSIKYMLSMLKDGSNGDTKNQIVGLLGNTSLNKYSNDKHMAFANALFIRDTYKNQINDDYISTIQNKYNGYVIYDSFLTSATINKWVKDNTLGLLENAVDNGTINGLDFMIVNALGINMNWYYQIETNGWGSIPGKNGYCTGYSHEIYTCAVAHGYFGVEEKDFDKIWFYNNKGSLYVPAATVAANINNYDIISDIGEEKMRKTITDEYNAFVERDECGYNNNESGYTYEDTEVVVDRYMKEIGENYKKMNSTTDFYYYDDSDVIAFGKDLREYNNTNLLYVGIMPKNKNINDYINNLDTNSLNGIINNLKDVDKLSDFEKGYIYKIQGSIPFFRFEYSLDLMEDLKKLGVVDAFDSDKADLTNITKNGAFIAKAIHKTNIEFGNEGIKASSVSEGGGAGDTHGCIFDYYYNVPVKEVEIKFNKPYLFVIVDKTSGDTWFAGIIHAPYTGE